MLVLSAVSSASNMGYKKHKANLKQVECLQFKLRLQLQ